MKKILYLILIGAWSFIKIVIPIVVIVFTAVSPALGYLKTGDARNLWYLLFTIPFSAGLGLWILELYNKNEP
jgi:hypothetical protein